MKSKDGDVRRCHDGIKEMSAITGMHSDTLHRSWRELDNKQHPNRARQSRSIRRVRHSVF